MRDDVILNQNIREEERESEIFLKFSRKFRFASIRRGVNNSRDISRDISRIHN